MSERCIPKVRAAAVRVYGAGRGRAICSVDAWIAIRDTLPKVARAPWREMNGGREATVGRTFFALASSARRGLGGVMSRRAAANTVGSHVSHVYTAVVFFSITVWPGSQPCRDSKICMHGSYAFKSVMRGKRCRCIYPVVVRENPGFVPGFPSGRGYMDLVV